MTTIGIHVAVEDDLSEVMVRRLLRTRQIPYQVLAVFKEGGFGYLRQKSPAFNNMAKVCPVMLLTDLDQRPCAPALLAEWLKQPKHPDFLLRVAVREVEAWLLACDEALKDYLALRHFRPFPRPEELEDPKMELLKLAEGSSRRDIREAVARRDTGGNLRQGPAYNSTLGVFVDRFWKPRIATSRCPSLKRALSALEQLETRWKVRHG